MCRNVKLQVDLENMFIHIKGGRRMKKGLKKFLALGLTTVLTVGALAGCGTQGDSGKSGSTG